MFRLLSGPPGFFCSGIQSYLLLSPYICFISLLYLDLYVLGDYALISYGSFMQIKHLCVLILQDNNFTDCSKAVLLLWIIYVISVLFCYAFKHVCLLMPCGYLLGKG